MKTFVLTTTTVLGLTLAASGLAYAAGQPQLPGQAQGQGAAQEQMNVKRSLDANKYQQPLPQTAANQTEQVPDKTKTGVGPRGTKVAPSTARNQPKQPRTAETGTPPRGTKVAPSTTPGQQGSQTR